MVSPVLSATRLLGELDGLSSRQASLPALWSKNAGEGACKVAGARDLHWDFRCRKPRQPLHQQEGSAGDGDLLVPPRSAPDSPGLGPLRSAEVPGQKKGPGPGPAGKAGCVGGCTLCHQFPSHPPAAFEPRSAPDLSVPGSCTSPPTAASLLPAPCLSGLPGI